MPRMTIPVHMRWSDIDGYRHVNNARMFTLLEEARIAAFWDSVPGLDDTASARAHADSHETGRHDGTAPAAQAADGPDAPDDGATPDDGRPGTKVLATGPGSGTNTFIARQEIEYLAPVSYTLQPLQVQMWISYLGGASIDVCYEIPSPDGTPAVRAMSTLVLIDESTGRPRRMSADERVVWERYMDDPIPFRRRDRAETAGDGA
ncbi:MAG: acyl-CoA thioesterase [Actinomycetaceae bacterium]